MNLRVQKLRQESLEAVPTISVERARLLTEVYQNAPTLKSYSVQRALAFEYLLSNKEICINDHELIVGERGPVPKGTPTYPEICCHSLADLDLLNTRKKIPYKVDKASRRLYETTIIPYWRGGTIREKVFSEMTQNWIDAYEAGIFTEFMEQRAPGHTVLDDKIYKMGMLDFMKKIESNLQALDYLNDAGAYHKQDELQAMAICARALIHYAERHAEKALEIAERETNPTRKAELEQIAEVCTRVPAHAPRNFWEALQYYWFVHRVGWTNTCIRFTKLVWKMEPSPGNLHWNCCSASGSSSTTSLLLQRLG
jgi:pyruvate-formate lyase